MIANHKEIMRFNEFFPAKKEHLCAVMSAIYYFDIFKHPLRRDEIQSLVHNNKVTDAESNSALHYLVDNGFLYEKDNFYVPEKSFVNISRRIKGNELSDKCWPKARSMSKLISKFPFIRCVMITGSLSKGFMDNTSDIDYLIITKPGRLWIARTLLIAFKKIFLLNSHKFFCVNYFLDQNHLVLNDRNLFTATELLFAKPTYNIKLFNRFIKVNSWTESYYPSFEVSFTGSENENCKPAVLKILLEKSMFGKPGNLLDNFCMKLTTFFWNRKFKQMSRDQYSRDMKSAKGISKHHPNGFRDKILNEHKQRMQNFISNMEHNSAIRKAVSMPVFNS